MICPTAGSITRRVQVIITAVFVGILAWATSMPAGAFPAPQIDPNTPIPSGTVGPLVPMQQRTACLFSTVIPESHPAQFTTAQHRLDLPQAWTISQGEGQRIAVIDTGIHPSSLLPNVEPGGDYIDTTDGMVDCDGHGTLVAGLIAGQPGPAGFSGVAPQAHLLAIRIRSQAYMPTQIGDDADHLRTHLTLVSMAHAVVHAADQGASIIVIPSSLCFSPESITDNEDQTMLGAALRYATEQKDALIIAAAGDTTSEEGLARIGSPCQSNPAVDLANSTDRRNWAGVTSVAIPAMWDQYVLSVGSVTANGYPSSFSMTGPWVGIAADGENILSVSNDDNTIIANGFPTTQERFTPLSGTGYAAGYVAGVAALVRSHYPDLSARQVRDRLRATAQLGQRSPSNHIGTGIINPLGALSWHIPASSPPPVDPQYLPAPPSPPPPNTFPSRMAFSLCAGLVVLVGIVAMSTFTRRSRKKDSH